MHSCAQGETWLLRVNVIRFRNKLADIDNCSRAGDWRWEQMSYRLFVPGIRSCFVAAKREKAMLSSGLASTVIYYFH